LHARHAKIRGEKEEKEEKEGWRCAAFLAFLFLSPEVRKTGVAKRPPATRHPPPAAK